MVKMMQAIEIRLWQRVDRAGGDHACWIWTGATTNGGYGVIGVGKQNQGLTRTHRVAWELTHGPIPSGMFVCHKCDNPPCCNPAHLFLGTHADNMADRSQKHRVRHGDLHASAKLQAADIHLIVADLAEGQAQRQIAQRYGVTQTTISQVKCGKTWKHLGAAVVPDAELVEVGGINGD